MSIISEMKIGAITLYIEANPLRTAGEIANHFKMDRLRVYDCIAELMRRNIVTGTMEKPQKWVIK